MTNSRSILFGSGVARRSPGSAFAFLKTGDPDEVEEVTVLVPEKIEKKF